MTERINTNAETAAPVEFTPSAADWFVQSDAVSGQVRIKVEAKIENAATWVTIDEFVPASTPIRKYAAVAYARVSMSGNSAKQTIKVWTV